MTADIANLILILVGITGLICWARFIGLCLARRCPPIRLDRSVIVRWSIGGVLFFFLVWLLFQIVGQVTAMSILGTADVSELSPGQRSTVHLASSIGGLLGGALAFLLVLLHQRHAFSEFGFSLRGIQKGVTIGAVAFVMTAPLVWCLFELLRRLMPYKHVAQDLLAGDHSTWGIVKVAFPAIVVASIVEELFFRVLLQGWLQKVRFGSLLTGNRIDLNSEPGTDRPWNPMAIVIASILFALAHFSQGPAPYALFLFSLGVGYVYQRSGNIIACIVMHMMLNSIGVTFMVIQASETAA